MKAALGWFAAALALTAGVRAKGPVPFDLWPAGQIPGQPADDPPETIRGDKIYHVHRPTMTAYLPSGPLRTGTGVVIFPGGGYVRLPVQHGTDATARWLNRLGVAAFVVIYRLGDSGVPAPLQDAERALQVVHDRAAEFGVRPDRIGAFGSSAGGHLAAWASNEAPAAIRPAFAIMLYPVITMEPPYDHNGSRRALLGSSPTEAQIAELSMERRVTPATPPSFLVATEEDRSVPMENSMMYYEALMRDKVPAELHLYQKGPHGFMFRPGLGDTSNWPQVCETWMRSHGWLTPIPRVP